MTNERYYAGMVAINLETGLTGVIGEYVDSLAEAEERFSETIEQAHSLGATVDEIAENTKDGVLKEVLVIGGTEVNILFISNEKMTTEPFQKQIEMQLFAHQTLKDMQESGSSIPTWLDSTQKKSFFETILNWAFSHPLTSLIIIAIVWTPFWI